MTAADLNTDFALLYAACPDRDEDGHCDFCSALDRLLQRAESAEAERDALKESNHGRLVAAWDDLASLRDQLQGRFEQIAELEARAEAAEAALQDIRHLVVDEIRRRILEGTMSGDAEACSRGKEG